MMFKGAIFDQDGLLFDTEVIYQRSWVEAAKRQGVEIDPTFPQRFCGRGRAEIAEITHAVYPELDLERYCREAIDLAWSTQLSGVPTPKKGLHEMLSFCRANGIKTAVASSSTLKVVRHNLESAGVLEFFDAITTGDDVVRHKPAPDIFLLAAERLGLDPRACCVFEDAYSGIEGAVAAGCRAVFIPDQLAPTPRIRAIAEVRESLADAIEIFFAHGTD